MRALKILLPFAIVALLFACSKEEVPSHASIAFFLGDVKVNNIPAQIEDPVKEDDIVTTGSNSFCDIKIGKSILRIKSDSSIRLSQLRKNGDFEKTQIELSTGKILCKPKKLLKEENFLVKTPTAVAAVRGTQFSVETDKLNTTRIKVFNGEVKVAKRLKYFDSAVEKVMDVATTVSQEEKVIITEEHVKEAEASVEQKLKDSPSSALSEENFMSSIIDKSTKEIAIAQKDIAKFKPEDFARENKEIIEVEEKPKDDLKVIKKVVKEDSLQPKAQGRIVITKYDIYFVKEGKVIWESKLLDEPLKKNDRIFLSTGNYVICSDEDGTVLWKVKIKNQGIGFRGNDIYVRHGKMSLKLRPSDGKRF